MATKLAEFGVQPHVIEALLNHASGHRAGVAGIYNRARYEADKREALERWARYLLAQAGRDQHDPIPPAATVEPAGEIAA